MPEITATFDTDDLHDHQDRVFARMTAVHELYPDSLAVARLHKALERFQGYMIDRLPGGEFQAMSGGGKSDPPPEGP